MLTPQGKPVHVNLATSYVLVDALVEELCAADFSGRVALAFGEAAGDILIDGGRVAVALARRGAGGEAVTTVADLAAQARREKGRVSVYEYPAGLAGAVARRLSAEPLYLRLSSDFADLGKMVYKLGREDDREWFIEVSPGDSAAAMIHVEGGRCRVIRPDRDPSGGQPDSLSASDHPALRELFDECKGPGCTFDVYFRRLTAGPESAAAGPVERVEGHQGASPTLAAETPAAAEVPPAAPAHPELSNPAPAAPPLAAAEDFHLVTQPEPQWTAGPTELPPEADGRTPDDGFLSLVKGAFEGPEAAGSAAAARRGAEPVLPPDPLPPGERLMDTGDLPLDAEEERMAEVKRLMGEIARTIEDATRAVEQKDRFPIALREGQLKVADRYPFLDPFGAEFEYLAGEIVFVGKAAAPEFIAGLTEALRLAVAGATAASPHPARLRVRIVEDLLELLDHRRAEFEAFGLDRVIEEIIS